MCPNIYVQNGNSVEENVTLFILSKIIIYDFVLS